MKSADPGQRVDGTDRAVARWASLSALATAAFVVVPPIVMPISRAAPSLPMRTRATYVEWWLSGAAAPPDSLQTLSEGWRDYHVIKALLAFACLIALSRVAALSWHRWISGGRARHGLFVAGSLGLALVALLLVMANLQGAAAPRSSLMSLLPPADSPGVYRRILTSLSTLTDAGDSSGAFAVNVADFAWFHLILAILAAGLAITLIAAAVRLAQVRPTSATGVDPARARHGFRNVAIGAALLGVLVGVLAVANVSTALDPAPAFRGFVADLTAEAATKTAYLID